MASMEFSRSGGWSVSRTASPWRQMGSPWERAGVGARAGREEEALRWAALERLPTYDRLRVGILRKDLESFDESEEEEARSHRYKYEEVDVTKMGVAQRRAFIERIFKLEEEDNATFREKLRDRIDKAGIQLPTVEIRFENLAVEAKCHVGCKALPTLLNEISNTTESALSLLGLRFSNLTKIKILKEVSGIIRPSRMTLLLGPPSSGKTTLLRALAGKLNPSLKSSGELTYNGHKLSEFISQKTAAYISQYDIHIEEMTVKETLNFSERCQGMGDRYELLSELTRREKARCIVPDPEVDLFMKALSIRGAQIGLQTDYIMKILGLDICADTIIGNDMQRGISGGQKKRVTTGEMIVGPMKILFMDEISTGLDSSTTHHVVKCLQEIVHLCEATILMSLLQPAPETFNLFDDIFLLAEGHIVYQGPRDEVLDFFRSCGFECPKRKGVADFLQEITSRKDQEQYWADKRKPYRFVSPTDFVKNFKRFRIGRNLQRSLSIPFDKKKSHGAALVFTRRSVPLKELLKASFSREWLLIKRNSFVYVFRAFQLFVVALIASTVFLRTNLHVRNESDGAIYIGALLFGLIVNLFNGFAEQSLAISRLPVFYKQRDLLLYPTWVFTIPNCILRIPISVVESAVWVIMTYFTIGFAPEASRFFKQLLIFILIQQMAAGFFRAVAGLTRSMTAGNTWGSILILMLICLGGFALPKDLIPKWWMLGYWLSPIMYSYTALAVNEMFSSRWINNFAPDGRKLGVAVLENINVFTNESWYWKSAGVLLAYAVLFNVLFTLCLMYLNPVGKPNPVVSEETVVGMEAGKALYVHRRNKIVVEMQSQGNNNGSTRFKSLTYEDADKYPHRRGILLPFIPLAMTFREVNYFVDMPPAMKDQGVTEDKLQLLSGVTGAFRPGVLTALMGVSGAGKTTLMDVLAGRKTGGYIEGDIRISGYPKKQSTFARISGYCEQFDVHSPHLTVRESLIFSALLRLTQDVSTEEKTKFVEEVMGLVELNILRDALVGLPGVNGLSIEQRKRLTIAVELVANPSIIFMDEPTSGLDARAAAIVMRAVRNTVNTGRTVVCTIHQPSIDIFESFDELLLLKRGGLVIYCGHLGENSQKLIEYFEAIPGVPKIVDVQNPAVWMLEASSIAIEEKLEINFADIYKASSLQQRNIALVKELSKPSPGSCDLYFSREYSQSSYVQFKICLWKYWSIYWRNPEYNLSRLGMALITALLLGSIFWKIGLRRSNSADLLSVIGAMYLAVEFVGFSNCSSVQPLIATERAVYYREKAAGMYSALPFALSQVSVEIPYVLFQSTYYTLIVYYTMSFQWTVVKFSWFFFITFLTFLYFTYYGMLSVAVSPNLQISGTLSASVFFLFDIFSGFFIPRPKIPKWWAWYSWVCPVAWTLYGLIVTQYSDIHDKINVPGQAEQRISDYIMNYFGYRNDYQGLMVAALMGFAFFFAFMYAFCLRSINFQQR
ncbi:Pleiotropic drug resistance protein 12 [Apostasia shenzhenica]|uniref:Pleiotropic drug resistance protein 12 n=1 Tax=Apostasia shenzhenica TaxID=1088818 RepID=A0A2I0BC11_9ASPA|nr:Pleiotropic drug resistance protein 12 [Apostasia shenzhenica]